MTKDLAYYMGLPYTRKLRRDEDGDIIASVDELAGCVAHGETDDEALSNLADVQEGWIEARLAAGLRVPEPEREPVSSGKWVQRTTRSLHRELTLLAQREGVSLNHLVSVVLARAAEILRAGSLDVVSRRPQAPHMLDVWGESENDWTIQGSAHPAVHKVTIERVRGWLPTDAEIRDDKNARSERYEQAEHAFHR